VRLVVGSEVVALAHRRRPEHRHRLGAFLLRHGPALGRARPQLGGLLVELGDGRGRGRLRDHALAGGDPLDQPDDAQRESHHEHDRQPAPTGHADDHAHHDQEERLAGDSREGRRQRPLGHTLPRPVPAAACLPRLHRPAGAADRPELRAKLCRGALEDLDGLERAQRRVELGGVPVEGVEGLADLLAVVALLGDRQILDPGQGRGAPLRITRRRRLGRRPFGVAHP
jgi:hypothetical protein